MATKILNIALDKRQLKKADTLVKKKWRVVVNTSGD